MSDQAKTAQIISQIARQHLRIETLQVRNSDRLDFHDCGVASIEAALKAAFEAGKQACSAAQNSGLRHKKHRKLHIKPIGGVK